MGDSVVWVADAGVMYSGDLVEYKSACYCGDAHLEDWPRALKRIAAFRPRALMPGRGAALMGLEKVAEGLTRTAEFLTILRDTAADCVAEGKGIKETYLSVKAAMDPLFSDYAIYEHCLPFNVARAYDEAQGLDVPNVWTAERDRDLWDALHGLGNESMADALEIAPLAMDEQVLSPAMDDDGETLEEELTAAMEDLAVEEADAGAESLADMDGEAETEKAPEPETV